MSLVSPAKRTLEEEIKELDLSGSSSKKINWSQSSSEKIQKFPEFDSESSAKSNSNSEDDSLDVSNIKTKNSGILKAIKNSMRSLKNRSKEYISSLNDEESQSIEKSADRDFKGTTKSNDCIYISTEFQVYQKNTEISQLKYFVDGVKQLNSTLAESKSWIKKELKMIKQVDDENEVLKNKLEQIVYEACNTSASEENERCKCLIV